MRLKFFLSALFFFLYFPVLATPESSISIDSKVDKSTIKIGDLITYSVIVTRVPEVEVEMPELAANLGAFEIRDYIVHEPADKQGKIVDRIDYIISTFDVGEFEIPPLTFYYYYPPDSTRNEIKTQKIQINVESLKPSEAGDIRDIKSPLEIPRNYRQWIIWGSIGFAALLLIGILFYIWRRKKAGGGLLPEKVEPPRPAHEVALDELNALEQSSLLSEGKIKEFYIKISEIIRRYIEGRYFVIAMELTTFEVIAALKEADTDGAEVALIHDFLDKCDLVKFAKYKPSDSENSAIMEKAFEIVEHTKLVYETEQNSEKEKIASDEQSSEIVDEIEQPVGEEK